MFLTVTFYQIDTKFIWLTSVFALPDKANFTQWLFHDVLEPKMASDQLTPTQPLLAKGGLPALRRAVELTAITPGQKVIVSLEE